MSWGKRTTAPPRLRGRASQERRAEVLARNGGRCVRCNQVRAAIADHIVNLGKVSGRDDRTVTASEMQGLCKSCHDAKTHEESMTARPSRKREQERHPGDLT